MSFAARFTARLVHLWFAALACVTLVLAPPAYAGSEDVRVGVERYGEERIREFTLKLNDALDARKATVAIIARAGRSRADMPKGVRYTHVAFAVFERVRGNDGVEFYTYAVYNLYQGGKGEEHRATLKQDLTYNFVAGILEPDLAVCIPVEPLQKRLLATIRSPAYRALFTSDYNLLANPWVDRFDNCVTHTLKICVAAIYQTNDRARIYENIRTYFRPTPIRLGVVKSIGSNFVAGLSYDDVDPSGLQTATYDSLKTFLEENGLVKEAFTLALN